MSLPREPWLRPLLAAAVAGILMGSCYRNLALFPLAWFGLTPLLWAISTGGCGRAYWLGTLFGLIWQACASSWIAAFIEAVNPEAGRMALVLAILYWLLCAQLFGLLMALLQWLRRRAELDYRWTLPILGTLTFESLPMLFPVALGATQTRFHLSLQALDLTGPLGITAVMLYVNAALHTTLVAPRRSGGKLWVGLVLPGLWFGYGFWAHWHWRSRTAQLPLVNIGLVQADMPASVAPPLPEAGYGLAYSPERELFEQLSQFNPTLVLWPEARYRGYFEFEHVRRALQATVELHNTPLLLQDLDTRGEQHFNSAVLLQPGAAPQQYRKRALIPFGEYIPSPLPAGLGKTLLGPFFSPLTPGDKSPLLALAQLRWLPLICYEVASPAFVARSIHDAGRSPQWISVQSNDAWFADSPQPELHVAVSQLRAVEHRLAVVHVINNGPSTLIDPSGQIKFRGQRDQRRGYLVAVPIAPSQHTTFYNRHPDLIRNFLLLLALGLLLRASANKWLFDAGRSPADEHCS